PPSGGSPGGRPAFSQGAAPTLRFAAVGGAPLVTFAVAVTGGLLAVAVWHACQRSSPRTWRRFWRFSWWRSGWRSGWRWSRTLAPLLGAAALPATGLLIPVGASASGTATVAIVQGNVPRLGLDFNAQRRAVLDNHVEATISLARQVAAGAVPRPQLVVWPENSSDIDPLLHPDAAARIRAAATAIGAPILVGAVLQGPGPRQVRNVGLLWQPDSGPDLAQLYVKRHPVPFAEYVPMRSLARRVSAEVDRVRNDFVGGDRPGVLRSGPLVAGDVICFEVAYDGLVRDTVTGGAQLLLVQTNNATFNEAEALQQLAMVRLRAVEHGRDALMASTVGVSAFVDTSGRVWDATEFNTAAVVVREMRLSERRTLATQWGVWPEMVLVSLAGAIVVSPVLVRRRKVSEDGAADAEAR
ncbi:MAG: apolipoprotein N-acyltransferase, partial [Actinobacteria bacterium]